MFGIWHSKGQSADLTPESFVDLAMADGARRGVGRTFRCAEMAGLKTRPTWA